MHVDCDHAFIHPHSIASLLQRRQDCLYGGKVTTCKVFLIHFSYELTEPSAKHRSSNKIQRQNQQQKPKAETTTVPKGRSRNITKGMCIGSLRSYIARYPVHGTALHFTRADVVIPTRLRWESFSCNAAIIIRSHFHHCL